MTTMILDSIAEEAKLRQCKAWETQRLKAVVRWGGLCMVVSMVLLVQAFQSPESGRLAAEFMAIASIIFPIAFCLIVCHGKASVLIESGRLVEATVVSVWNISSGLSQITVKYSGNNNRIRRKTWFLTKTICDAIQRRGTVTLVVEPDPPHFTEPFYTFARDSDEALAIAAGEQGLSRRSSSG